eukprot:Opistho-2@93296
MSAPEGCPVAVHAAMEACWRKHPETRPNFAQVVITMRRAMQALCSGVGGMMDLNIAGDNAMLDASGQEVSAVSVDGAQSNTLYVETTPNPMYEESRRPAVKSIM